MSEKPQEDPRPTGIDNLRDRARFTAELGGASAIGNRQFSERVAEFSNSDHYMRMFEGFDVSGVSWATQEAPYYCARAYSKDDPNMLGPAFQTPVMKGNFHSGPVTLFADKFAAYVDDVKAGTQIEVMPFSGHEVHSVFVSRFITLMPEPTAFFTELKDRGEHEVTFTTADAKMPESAAFTDIPVAHALQRALTDILKTEDIIWGMRQSGDSTTIRACMVARPSQK